MSHVGPLKRTRPHSRGGFALRLLTAACAFCAASAALGQQFPYTAFVNAPDVYLRCGPGDNYYPVAKLEHGQKVEIYRHDPGGWYAIKPPEGSFSWVSAEFVEPRQGNLGMVIGEHVVARVGSSFSDTRDVIQVRLDRGEEVEILEAREFNSGPAAQTWYKISPPAGEFRWISGRYVDRQLAEVAPREPSADNNLLLARHRRREPHDAAEHVSDRRRRHREEPADEEAADDWEEIDGDVRPAAHEEPPRRTKAASKKPRRVDPEPEEDDVEAEEAADEDERPARLRPEHRRPKANLKEEAADLDFALSA
ncbi:MAG TPA: SH3 domain-containing protein, partial [Pirellulales bacterium]